MTRFMKNLYQEVLDETWEKLHRTFCTECDGSCRNCPIDKAKSAITEMSDRIDEEG